MQYWLSSREQFTETINIPLYPSIVKTTNKSNVEPFELKTIIPNKHSQNYDKIWEKWSR